MRRFAILILAAALSAGTAYAQADASPAALSPDDAVALAVANNASLARDRVDLAAAGRALGRAWNSLLPGITLSTGMSRANATSNETIYGSLGASVTLSPMVFNSVEQARAAYEAERLAYDTAVRSLELSVRKAFFSLVLARENISVLRQSIATAQKSYDQAEAKRKAGLASELDALSALVSLENLKPSLQSALVSYESQVASFKQLLGVDQAKTVDLRGSLSDAAGISAIDFPAVSGVSPSVSALQKSLELAQARRKAARTLVFSPALTLSGSYRPTSVNSTPFSDSGSLSAALSFSLDNLLPWSSAREAADKAGDSVVKLESELDEAAIKADIAALSLQRKIEQSLGTLNARRLTVALAERTYRLTEDAFKFGTKDLLNLQDAADKLQEARVKMLEEAYNLVSALLDLEYALGVPFGTLGEVIVIKRNLIIIAVFAIAIATVLLLPKARTAQAAGNPGAAPASARPAAGAAPGGGSSQRQTGQGMAFTVKTSGVKRRTLQDYIETNGDIVVDSTVEVYPNIAGKLVSLRVYLGSRVSKGQLIAEVDPSTPGSAYALNPVYAPISGTITSLPVSTGSTVGVNTAIAKVGVIDQLQVAAAIPERYLGVLRTGLRAAVSLEAYPGETFAASVTRVSPVVDSTSRTKEIRLSFDRVDERVNAGMYAKLKLNTKAYPDRLVVVEDALRSDSSGDFVFVVNEDKTVSKRPVQKGIVVDGTAEIVSGLKEGETVVVEGASVLSDGAGVRDITPREGRAVSIAKKVVERPVLIAVIFALVAIVGLYTLTDIALDLMPESDMPMLMVSTSYPGASPQAVEKSITKPLESALINVGGLKNISSTSSEGSSRISLEFGYEVKLEDATNDMRDRLERVKSILPDDASSPRIFHFDPNSMPIMRIAVSGKRTAEDLKELAEAYIAPRLEQVDGIAQADVTGGRAKIVRVELSQNRLDAYNLTVTGVAATLANQNLELGGGKITEGTKNYLVRTSGEFKSVREIADAVVTKKGGYSVRLSDLGSVFAGYKDQSSAVYINGQPGIYVSLTKQSGSNTVQAADGVYAKLLEIQKLLPADVGMEIISDDSGQIRGTLNNLVSSAYWGAALTMAVLFLFLRSIKSTIIIGVSIPLSMLVTLLAMFLADITLNMMTMAGLILGVGMIVDASIVILENIYQYRERGAKPKIAAVLGSQEMIAAILSSNLTTVFVFIPVLFFKNRLGMIGQIFSDMIFTIVIALASSLLVAIFLIPVLVSHYLEVSTRTEKPLRNSVLIKVDKAVEGAIGALTRAYQRGLEAAIKHRPTTVLLVIGALALSLTFIPRMNISLIPPSSDDSVSLNVTLPVGTALSETQTVLLSLEAEAEKEIQGSKNIITTVGRQNSSYRGQLTIQLPAYAERLDGSDEVKQKLRAHFQEYPNASFGFSMGRMQRMSGSSDIDVAVRTQDLDAGILTAQNLIDLIKAKVPDVTDVQMDMTEGLPQVEVVIDRDRAYSFGVDVKSIANEIYASVDGYTATTYREGGNEYGVVLMFREADRSRIPDLERIFVKGSTGRVPVSNFASLEKSLGPVSIARKNQSRIIHVTADIISDERPDRVEKKIQDAVAASLVLPEGVSLSYEGSWDSISETGGVFILIVSMALLLVFGVMAGQYESFKDPIINLFTIPLLVIGVVAVYVISGQALTMFTAIGVVMLVGLVVNNGIVLVDYTNLLVRRGVPVKQACVEAGAARLRPVLMTTFSTILGLIPLSFFPGENSGLIQPIGLTVIGGLSSSTFITLFFIPVMYSFFNEKRGHNRKEAA